MVVHILLGPKKWAIVLAIIVLQSCSSTKKNYGSSSNVDQQKPTSALQKKYATLLGVPTVNIGNHALYSFIDTWLNTSYVMGGQSSKGIDCSAFTQMLYDAVYRKKLPRTSEAQYDKAATFTNQRNLVEGDLVFFTTIKGKKISHVGIYLQNNRFVNATSKGVAISDMGIKYWTERFVGGGRVP